MMRAPKADTEGKGPNQHENYTFGVSQTHAEEAEELLADRDAAAPVDTAPEPRARA